MNKKLKIKQLKNKNGITLIALVVTIIVLIILAGVSISLVLGDNGIITKAKEAKVKNQIAKEKELIELAIQAAKITGLGILKTENLEDELNKNISDYEFLTAGDEIFIKVGQNEYKIKKDGTVEFSSERQNEEENKYANIKIGSFIDLGINYTNVTGILGYNNEYLSGTWNTNGQTGWRVISNDSKLILISAGSPLTYRLKNISNDTVNNLNNLKKNINLETGSETEGFIKNGFNSNNLEEVFGSDYIETVRAVNVDDFVELYKKLSGNSTETIESIKSKSMNYPFRTDTIVGLTGNKMSENYSEDLLCNGFYYILNGKLVNQWKETVNGVEQYSNYMYYATASGFNGLDYGSEWSIRPVITLKSDVIITGEGTVTSPYEITVE